VAVVGAPGDDDVAPWCGAANAYRFDPNSSQWDYEAKLVPDGADEKDKLGGSVATCGERIVVAGEPFVGPGGLRNRPVYVYLYDDGTEAWVEETFFENPNADGPNNDWWAEFGDTVAISDDGETIVVGAPGAGWPFDSPIGKAYVYRFYNSTWHLDETLHQGYLDPNHVDPNDPPKEFGRFGDAVAVSGDWIVVGASQAGPGSPSPGRAYFYELNDNNTPGEPADDWWEWKFTAWINESGVGDLFGDAVSIRDDTVVIGAYADPPVYVYRFDDSTSKWGKEDEITPTGWELGHPGGFADEWVTVDGDALAVVDHAEVWVFRRIDCDTPDLGDDHWAEHYRITPPGRRAPGTATHCTSVGLSGTAVVAGYAEYTGAGGFHPGRAHVHDDGQPCPGDVDGDCATDQSDLGILISMWEKCYGAQGYDPRADLDGDGCVDQQDLGILLADWGCGT
jgi:hypothetical protein